MIYTDLTRKAIKIAFMAHAGQLDKSGTPYVCHPLHVAEQMEDERYAATALLHDVVEDTSWTEEMLREAGIPEDVLEAVMLLTRDGELPYANYLQRIVTSNNRMAVYVKYQDVLHNSDETRMAGGKQPTYLRERYKMARELLENALMKTEGAPQGGTT